MKNIARTRPLIMSVASPAGRLTEQENASDPTPAALGLPKGQVTPGLAETVTSNTYSAAP
jgi:hypothetical protein